MANIVLVPVKLANGTTVIVPISTTSAAPEYEAANSAAIGTFLTANTNSRKISANDVNGSPNGSSTIS